MNKGNFSLGLLATFGLAATTLAQADTTKPGCIALKTVAEVEESFVNERGEQSVRLKAAAKVVPGDQVIWTVTAANVCDKAADRVFIDNPVPNQMTYVADSATEVGAEVLFSLDGARFATPRDLLVKNSDGTARAARPDEYTHIRWNLRNPIAPGQMAVARFRATLK